MEPRHTSEMLTVVRADDAITHLRIAGRLDIVGVRRIQDEFVAHTTGRGRPALIDLSELTFIASLGIGLLVGAAKALQREGARMVLLRPRELVLGALEMAGIARVIPIVELEDEALALLR